MAAFWFTPCTTTRATSTTTRSARSPRPPSWPATIGGDAAALVVGEVDDAACAALGKYGAAKVYRAKSVPEGLAQPIVDAMAKVITDDGYSYALFGGGLLGFEIGAGLTARLNAGVTMEVTAVKVADGKLVAERPILQDSAIVDVGYVSSPGSSSGA